MVMSRKDQAPKAEYAVFERTHAVAGLFAALPKGERPRREVVLTVRDDEWHFTEPWALDASDQTLLLTILALIAQQHLPLVAETAAKRLALTGEDALQAGTIYMETSAYHLCRSCGWEWSGPRGALLRASLTRLSHVAVDVTHGDTTTSGGTLLARTVNRRTQRIAIAISPWLAEVLIDPARGLWVRIDLAERRRLETDTARLLHAWLCTWLRPGDAGRVRVDTLIPRIWPGEASALVAPGTWRRRRHDIRLALAAVARLDGWSVEESAHSVVTIHRAPLSASR